MPEKAQGTSTERSDAELVVCARGGDDASFVVLYERHFASARRLAGLYATSPADAEDLASEGFAQVLGAIRAGGGPQWRSTRRCSPSRTRCWPSWRRR
ncbi:RNA polymerase sigma factor [Streptomyces albospinus]|uniref:RNA polymerase sigma factor n=1 Tax=Streptomyces albospinus TaxID=285515 RepID=UPI00166FFBA6|nr:sigma factor [Streptomyces albospinus]